MNIHDSEHTGGHEIDPNLVEIADMLRIQDEMHKVTAHAEDRLRILSRCAALPSVFRKQHRGEVIYRPSPSKPRPCSLRFSSLTDRQVPRRQA